MYFNSPGMRYTPSPDECRRDIREWIRGARKHDEAARLGVVGVVDVDRLNISRAWPAYRRSVKWALNPESDE